MWLKGSESLVIFKNRMVSYNISIMVQWSMVLYTMVWYIMSWKLKEPFNFKFLFLGYLDFRH